MLTIVWADAVMGLDNALGIAAAAGGNWWLIVFGLLISVPIILFGSTVISRLLERWPKLIWVGGSVLVLVAGQMIYEEPLLQELASVSSK
jgi:predicted tellurium resistance membrane protein TerC